MPTKFDFFGAHLVPTCLPASAQQAETRDICDAAGDF